MPSDVAAIVLAAGSGRRMGGTNKALLPLAGQPLLAHCLAAFQRAPCVGQIVVVMNDMDLDALQKEWNCTPQDLGADVVVAGGAERWQSSQAGCLAADASLDFLLVHDAARALVDSKTIEAVAQACRESGAALAAEPLADTLKKEAAGGRVAETISRDHLWRAQTPQGARREDLLKALEQAQGNPTDESSLLEAIGVHPLLVPSPSHNFKITRPADLALADALLAAQKTIS